jgi:hypothetical protein
MGGAVMYRSWTFIFFSIAAVLFLLQVLPMPGIYLMMFGAVFWTGLLLMAGLIAMGVEAHLRRVPRFLILVPIAVFGGYYGVAIWQRVKIDRAHYPDVPNILLGIPIRKDGAGPFSDRAALHASVNEDGQRYADLVFDDLFSRMDEADYMPLAHSDKILARYPERLHGHGAELARAYASVLKEAIGNNNARPPSFAQRRGLLLNALSMLPYDEFRAAAPDLVDAVVTWRHDPLYVRAAMPDAAYKELYFTAFRESWAKRKQSRYQELEVIALCRIGNLPADIVHTIRSRYMEAGVDPEGVRQAYFLLLLKAGAQKAAVAGLPPQGDPARQWHDRILAGEGNGPLGPNNCLPDSRVVNSELKLSGSAADLQPVLTD